VAKAIDVKREIVCGVVDLIRHKQFYGHILQQLDKIFISGKVGPFGTKTMSVGKRRGDILVKLFINEDYVKRLFANHGDKDGWNYLIAALEHEVLHLVFDHLTLTFSDKLRGNVAVDLVVNSCIEKDRIGEGWLTPEMYGFEPNKSAFWYYQNLQGNSTFQQQCAQGQFGAQGLFSDAVDSHKIWEEARKDPVLAEFVKDIVRQAKELCNKSYGSIPGKVLEQIEDILRKKKQIVPWQRVLRLFCASSTESVIDFTMKRVSRRFGTRPGSRKGDVLNLAVAVDTSGSISDRQLLLFFNEIRWIWKNGAIVTVYEADCDVQSVYEFRGKFNGKVHGRGGTDLEPVLKEVEGRYDALIYFTDFYAPPIAKRYGIPTLWVLTTELSRDKFPYKWGKFIKIEDARAIPA